MGITNALGIVVNSQSCILTVDHAVAGARDITVTFANGSETSAEVIGTDPANDIAVLEVKRMGRQKPVTLGDSGSLRKGVLLYTVELVPTTDSTGAFTVSLSEGSIVDLHKKIEPLRSGVIAISKSVGTEAAGGPVFDQSGNVVAITLLGSVKSEPTADAVHAAVPINVAKPTLDRLNILYTTNR